MPFSYQERQGVEQQIRRARRSRCRGSATCRGSHLAGCGIACQASRKHGGGQRVEVDLARERQVQRLKPLRCAEQKGRRLAAAIRGEGESGSQDVRLRSLELVERACLRTLDEPERLVERPRLLLRLGRREGPPGPMRGVGRQYGRALEEGCGRGETTPRLRSSCGALELRGNILVGHRGRLRSVPGASIWVDVLIGRLGECTVNLAPLVGPRGPVHRRASEWMTEHHTAIEREETVRLDRLARPLGDSEPLRRTPHEGQIADRLGRGQEQKAPRIAREPRQPPSKALLDLVGQGQRLRQAEATRELRRGQAARQLQQRERVAACLDDKPL